jgi:hypothetical protein
MLLPARAASRYSGALKCACARDASVKPSRSDGLGACTAWQCTLGRRGRRQKSASRCSSRCSPPRCVQHIQHTYAYMNIYIHTYTHAYIHAYHALYMSAHTAVTAAHAHTHAHTHTHTHTQERQRISRFRFGKDAKLALVGRLLLQHAACSALAQPFGMVDFARTKEGKPVITPSTRKLCICMYTHTQRERERERERTSHLAHSVRMRLPMHTRTL